MERDEISEQDDWWKFKERVVSFNKKRLSHYHTSHILVFDESMSAFSHGNLPNLSYMKRKPEPLGAEFKIIVDGMTGAMLWLEIQEGKVRMSNKEH